VNIRAGFDPAGWSGAFSGWVLAREDECAGWPSRRRTGAVDAAGHDRVAMRPVVPPTVQEESAARLAADVLGVTPRPTGSGGFTLAYPDGRRAALEVAAIGEPDGDRIDGDRGACLRWPAPGRWWWQVAVDDVRGLPRVRELFPVVARACEAAGARGPAGLPAAAIAAIPDLHWLVHTAPARLTGDPTVLDRPTTVTLGPGRSGRPGGPGMDCVGPALRGWLAADAAGRALTRLSRRRAGERQLYLAVGCTTASATAVQALVRAAGVPPPPPTAALTHLWLTAALGRTAFLWSGETGWTRHDR
jgi:hypothetical protein